MSDLIDEQMMRRCLELAKSAQGRTSPNPMVGSVIVAQDGTKVAEGFHQKAGLAHAEVMALNEAGERAKGSTLYVNLEPCSHFGRTPPCADRVIESGISRVIVGMQDPNPKVCGAGITKLRNAGINVEFSKLENECKELNRAFIKRITTGLPWLALKMASTLDGRIADRNGKSRWISGPEARVFVHQLRNTYDCVLIGGTTAAIDDPELNVREIEGARNPHRAVIDPSLQISPDARLCKHSADSQAWTVIFSRAERIKNAAAFPDRVTLVDPKSEKANSSFLQGSLFWLAEQNVQSVLCEGGGRLAAALIDEGLLDEVYWIISPKFFSDALAVPSLAGQVPVSVENCHDLKELSYTQLGQDMLLRGKTNLRPSGPA